MLKFDEFYKIKMKILGIYFYNFFGSLIIFKNYFLRVEVIMYFFKKNK